jgi:hypothetical protein
MAPRPPPPKLLHKPKPSKPRVRYQCTINTCPQTSHPGARCARHSTDAAKRNQTRLNHKTYNAKGNRRWQPAPMWRIPPSLLWRPHAYILVSGAFSTLSEETISEYDPGTLLAHGARADFGNTRGSRTAPQRLKDRRPCGQLMLQDLEALPNPIEPRQNTRGPKRSPTRRASEEEPEQRLRLDSPPPQLPSHIEPARQVVPKRLRSPTKAEKLAWRQKSLRPRRHSIPDPQELGTMLYEDTVNISGPTKGRLLATQYLISHAHPPRVQTQTPAEEQSTSGPAYYNTTGRPYTTPTDLPENALASTSRETNQPQPTETCSGMTQTHLRPPTSRTPKRPLETLEQSLQEPNKKISRSGRPKMAPPTTPNKSLIGWGGEDPILSSQIAPTTQQPTPTPLDLGQGGSASSREGQAYPVPDQDIGDSRPYNQIGSSPLGEMDVG